MTRRTEVESALLAVAILLALALVVVSALVVTSRERGAREADTFRADLARPQAINGAPR